MNYILKKAILLLTILISGNSLAQKQNKPISWLALDSTFQIQPFMMVQLWNTYSYGMMIDSDKDGILESIDNRNNILLRRARLGFRANPYPGLNFTVVGFYDGVGYDALSAGIGAANCEPVNFGIWDAFFTWQPFKNKESIHIVGGYFRPQIGRESITSGFATTSGEKALQQTYLRKHLVNAGHGRSTGVNIGGLLFKKENGYALNYNVGIFNAITPTSLNNTAGAEWAPLLTGRAVLYIGDPEMKKYKIGYKTNYYNQRKGLSLGIAATRQGLTDQFSESNTLSFDALFNLGPLNFDVDWHLLSRKDYRETKSNLDEKLQYQYSTGHIRGSYNILINQKILEPVLMVMVLRGATEEFEQEDAKSLGAFSGTETFINAGFNYYINEHKLKIIAHYTSQNGTQGRNIFSTQGPLGVPIQRGNYFVFGLNAIF